VKPNQHTYPAARSRRLQRSPSAHRFRWGLVTALIALGLAVVLFRGGGALSGRDGGLPLLGATGGGASAADGRVGDERLTIEDGDQPTIANLDPNLRDAVRAATAEARAEDVEVLITSGWRSRTYQQKLLDEAVQKYGSREEALRWVATPDQSQHVQGQAVDIGPTQAAYWMARHGARYGLCQVYSNEIWHYELLTTPGGRCPTLRTDGAS
jgi:D-alanyl-D-alanine carboxypeptidase